MAPKLKQYEIKRDLCITRVKEIYNLSNEAAADPNKRLLFKIRATRLNELMQDFNNSHSEILALAEDHEDQDTHRILFEKYFYSAETIFYTLFESDEDLNASVSTNNDPRPTAKLPKISLPVFDGNFQNWPSFIDLFDSLIHRNRSISNIEKFQYLITSLTNEPLNLVKTIPVAEPNYQIAYDALTKRYQDKRKLATLYYSKINNFPKLNEESPGKLRQLLNTFSENLNALATLNFPTKEWDFLLFNMLLSKLDVNTIKRFELEHSKIEIPTFENLKDFVNCQCKALDAVPLSPSHAPRNFKPNARNTASSSDKNTTFSYCSTNTNKLSESHRNKCLFCNNQHSIYKCHSLLASNPQQRYNAIKMKKLCVNCLGSHAFKDCSSNSTCRICKQKHHSLLHFNRDSAAAHLNEERPASPTEVASNSNSSNNQPTSVHSFTTVLPSNGSVLLSTAQIDAMDVYGNPHKIRVLLDSGSESSFITEECFHRLGLKRSHYNIPISGIAAQSIITTKGQTTCIIRPRGNATISYEVNPIILPKICPNMPHTTLNSSAWSHLKDLDLADPEFYTPKPIHLLLGADMFPYLLKQERLYGNPGDPVALNTIFGWIVMGKIADELPSKSYSFLSSLDSQNALDSTLKKFWEIEEVPYIIPPSGDDQLCEKLFSDSHSRDDEGRFIVSLPFKSEEPFFSNSRTIALRRFLYLEKRLKRDVALYDSYKEFMREYLQLDHMTLLKNCSDTDRLCHSYYIPHHCVLRPESSTTKLRVVFDASCKASEGRSLNDTLLAGPKLQQDLSSILLNFRRYEIVFTADVRQMYRQILITPIHRPYQRILWRFSDEESIQDFQLNTVTYGVSSAPFLALRCLRQLAIENEKDFPLASTVLSRGTFVDDCVFGADSLETALKIKTELIAVLNKGQFELRKWSSNSQEFLKTIPSSAQQTCIFFDESSEPNLKVLGLLWCPNRDAFSYNIHPQNDVCTKRTILSAIARFFDPLGFLVPITFFAKRLMQNLWCRGVGWDDDPPLDIVNLWNQFKTELNLVSSIKIDRRVLINKLSSIEIHGFGDASEAGYSAVVYFRVQDSFNNLTVKLICAKSKVSPLKRISLPRLELCAAVLLSDLIHFIVASYSDIAFSNVCAYSDSAVTIAWIKAPPYKWKTFIANRVSRIHDNVPPHHWRHVSSADNPADAGSRGLMPKQLIDHQLWWKGPKWLTEHSYEGFPPDLNSAEISAVVAEERVTTLFASKDNNSLDQLLMKYSSLPKIQRIVSYALRFLTLNKRLDPNVSSSNFSSQELHATLLCLVKYVQREVFTLDIELILAKRHPSKHLRKLSPFLDSNGVLRVGGRLLHASIPFEQKHPALLPRQHRLTELIITSFHDKYLHPGFKTLHYLLLQHFWIMSPKRAIRKCLSSCLKCFRCNPITMQPKMGNLPSYRVNELKAFQCVGVDFGGPYSITLSKNRGVRTQKAYICLFVCCTTKALHVELVSDLSTDAFLAALRRFVARRGRITEIHSDCGTNFIGAAKYLNDVFSKAVEAEHIKWYFNPPSAPHFGGLWEAGIKSVKTHLSRVIGDQILTYEELNTVLIQIEALLNSRPMYDLSSDPNDLTALSPGHFLTLAPLSTIPDSNLTKLNINRLDRWQLLVRMHQDFWKRWSQEYLHNLLQRSKRTQDGSLVKVGALVLLKDENRPPLKWVLARIVDVHPGRDNIIRVVTVKTANGFIKRPVVKLCPLPSQC